MPGPTLDPGQGGGAPTPAPRAGARLYDFLMAAMAAGRGQPPPRVAPPPPPPRPPAPPRPGPGGAAAAAAHRLARRARLGAMGGRHAPLAGGLQLVARRGATMGETSPGAPAQYTARVRHGEEGMVSATNGGEAVAREERDRRLRRI